MKNLIVLFDSGLILTTLVLTFISSKARQKKRNKGYITTNNALIQISILALFFSFFGILATQGLERNIEGNQISIPLLVVMAVYILVGYLPIIHLRHRNSHN